MRIWRLSVRRGVHFLVVKVRGSRLDDEARARLEEQFAIRTAEDVARELGHMKGAMMKAGQLLGFIIEGLPKPAQEALASLQADVPPMAPSLAESVIRAELGAEIVKKINAAKQGIIDGKIKVHATYKEALDAKAVPAGLGAKDN